MSRPLKIHELLDAKELEALETFCRERHRTVDKVEEWVLAHGFKISRGAVHLWLKRFRSEERFRASNDVARALLESARAEGGVKIAEAATLQLQTMLFEAMLQMQGDKTVTAKDLYAISAAHKSATSTQQLVGELRDAFDREVELAGKKRADGRITPEDIAKARDAIFGKK